jgi:hypothetical protein
MHIGAVGVLSQLRFAWYSETKSEVNLSRNIFILEKCLRNIWVATLFLSGERGQQHRRLCQRYNRRLVWFLCPASSSTHIFPTGR